MKNYFFILLTTLSLILISPMASAEYDVKIKWEQVQKDSSGNNQWVKLDELTLKKTESKTLFDTTVSYYDLGNSNTMIFFRITGGSVSGIGLEKNQQSCIKGDCRVVNNTPSDTGDMRLTLIDIFQQTTRNGTSSDNPIKAYISFDDDEITLSKTKTKTFDIPKELDKRDLDPDDIPEVSVNFVSSTPFDVSLKIETDKKDMDDPESKWSDSTHLKYILEDAAKYTFTVKYNSINPSGMTSEKSDTYTLDLKGISSGSSTTAAPLTPTTNEYTVYLPDTMKITMSKEGSFDPITDVVITPNGGNAFTFKFPNPGTYTAVYKSGSDSAEVRFTAKSSPTTDTTTSEPVDETVTGQQTQGFGDSNSIIIMAVGAVMVGGFLWMKKKGGRGGQKFDLHANRNG